MKIRQNRQLLMTDVRVQDRFLGGNLKMTDLGICIGIKAVGCSAVVPKVNIHHAVEHNLQQGTLASTASSSIAANWHQ